MRARAVLLHSWRVETSGAAPALGDRYEILADLGGGTFGQVFRARQRFTGQEVAIKTLRTRLGDSAAEPLEEPK